MSNIRTNYDHTTLKMGGNKFRTNLSLHRVRYFKSTRPKNGGPTKSKSTVLNHTALVQLAETMEIRCEACLLGECFRKNGKWLYLLLWIARSAEEHAALQELWIKENGTTVADWDTLDNKIGLEGILHGMETLLYSHGGEDINQLGQAILGDLWERSVSLFSTL